MSDTPDSQRQLMRRVIERDEAALSALYAEFSAQVYGVALYVLKDQTLAEEATQDTFLKIWNSAQCWDEHKGKLSTWILTIARFSAIDILRREKRHFQESGVDYEAIILQIGQPSVTRGSDWHDAQLLKSLIAQLPEDQIQAIELAFFQGMTHQEIAEHLSEPLGTVKSRIRSGLQSLRGLWLLESP